MMKHSGVKNLKSFLNSKNSIELPSNLLTTNRRSVSKEEKLPNFTTSKMLANPEPQNSKPTETITYIEQKKQKEDKSVLYKRLGNIRGNNKQLVNLSFSKMLSKMVVMDDEEEQSPPHSSFDYRIRQTSYVRPVPQKLFKMKETEDLRKMTKSIDINQLERPSRKLFKKYYMPNSQAAQTIFLSNYNRNDKYIYKEGKKVQCKRIHNFYTSHMFRTGYDKCFQKNTFRLTLNE